MSTSRTRTVTLPPVTGRSTEQRRTQQGVNSPSFEDQIRGYRRSQRANFMARQFGRRLANRLRGRNYSRTLEQVVQPNERLRRSERERTYIVPAEVLYDTRPDDEDHRVYTHRSEEALVCVEGQQQDRTFLQPESFEVLQRSGFEFIHVGAMAVRVQILHRQDEGTMALIVFRDNQWRGDQAILATAEVDLSRGAQMVYIIPNLTTSLESFYRNLQISVVTRGYENWRENTPNLLITRTLTARLSNTSNVGFAYSSQNVVDNMASNGVMAIPGRRYSTVDSQGLNWIIKPTTVNLPMQPTEVNTRNLFDGSISLRFSNYVPAPQPREPRFDSRGTMLIDEEELDENEAEVASQAPVEHHTVAVIRDIMDPFIKPEYEERYRAFQEQQRKMREEIQNAHAQLTAYEERRQRRQIPNRKPRVSQP